MVDELNDLRCKGCGKLLGRNLVGRAEIVCPRCKRYNKFVIMEGYNSHRVVVLEQGMLNKIAP